MKMEEKITTHEDLKTYKAGRELRMFISQTISPTLLNTKEFELNNQIKRSARSITANIAEGYGRYHYLDNAKFCSNARGSLYETLEHIVTAHDENIITDNELNKGRELFENTAKLLNGYINYLYKSAEKSK